MAKRRARKEPPVTHNFNAQAPAGFEPSPCPVCAHMPVCESKKEVLGGLLETSSAQIKCINPLCASRPKTTLFGRPGWTAEVGAELEKMALFDWNTRIADPAEQAGHGQTRQ